MKIQFKLLPSETEINTHRILINFRLDLAQLLVFSYYFGSVQPAGDVYGLHQGLNCTSLF